MCGAVWVVGAAVCNVPDRQTVCGDERLKMEQLEAFGASRLLKVTLRLRVRNVEAFSD